MSHLKNPTPQLVQNYLRDFQNDARYQEADQAIERVIEQFPNHNNIEAVLIKVCLINELYSTGVFNTYQMATHIKELEIGHSIANGNPEAVYQIASGHKIGPENGKERVFYSFATKYCSWHNHKDYPIFDGFVEKILIDYRSRDGFSNFKNKELKDYALFKAIVEDFREYYGLENFNFKQLDKFLWKYGKTLNSKK